LWSASSADAAESPKPNVLFIDAVKEVLKKHLPASNVPPVKGK